MSVVAKTASLLIFALCLEFSWTQDGSIPLWKNLLIKYSSWAGYLQDSTSRYISSLRTLSVQHEDYGSAHVEFTSQHFTIEMEVYSEDDSTVVFKETTTWTKEAHFTSHSNLEFKGRFVWDEVYFKFLANVSSREEKDFGNLTLLPEGTVTRQRKTSSSKVGLYIGIPVVLAIIVLSLGGLVLYWGFRKGYLRHVPWSYKSFPNGKGSKKDEGIDMHKAQTLAEEPTVHI